MNVLTETLEVREPLGGLFAAFGKLPPAFTFHDCMESLKVDVLADHFDTDIIEAFEITCADHAERIQEYNPNLSLCQLSSVALYTGGFTGIKDVTFYAVMNSYLRNKNRNCVKPFRHYIWLFMHTLNKCPPFTGRMVHRGVKIDDIVIFKSTLALYKKDKTFTWCQFTSCSSDSDALSNPMFCGTSGQRIMFNIELTTMRARIINHLSMHPEEKEVLLPLNFRFMVVSVTDVGHGLYIICLREVKCVDPVLVFDDCRPENIISGNPFTSTESMTAGKSEESPAITSVASSSTSCSAVKPFDEWNADEVSKWLETTENDGFVSTFRGMNGLALTFLTLEDLLELNLNIPLFHAKARYMYRLIRTAMAETSKPAPGLRDPALTAAAEEISSPVAVQVTPSSPPQATSTSTSSTTTSTSTSSTTTSKSTPVTPASSGRGAKEDNEAIVKGEGDEVVIDPNDKVSESAATVALTQGCDVHCSATHSSISVCLVCHREWGGFHTGHICRMGGGGRGSFPDKDTNSSESSESHSHVRESFVSGTQCRGCHVYGPTSQTGSWRCARCGLCMTCSEKSPTCGNTTSAYCSQSCACSHSSSSTCMTCGDAYANHQGHTCLRGSARGRRGRFPMTEIASQDEEGVECRQS